MFAYSLSVTGTSPEQAGKVEQAIDAREAPGLVLHAGGVIPGGYRYVELWTSREAAMSFHDTHVRQALAGAGLDLGQLDVQIAEVPEVTTLVAGEGVELPPL